MEIVYGQGEYQEGSKHFSGRIVLSEHKLFLKDEQGQDLPQTYIPLEKIEKIKQKANVCEVYVRPAITVRYQAVLKGEKSFIDSLVKELVQRRRLKKQFLRREWIEEIS
ncbi:MAG: hypothetical protein KC684_04760 [Candidatus Omnitrophica bacterium]|nr:hypothetical protein [Candidatus Omnitrophota bacterium]